MWTSSAEIREEDLWLEERDAEFLVEVAEGIEVDEEHSGRFRIGSWT
ncbi:MAG: hypothetical protein ACOC3C_01990 [Candidatus Thorarchaeota archaeon]